MQRLPRLGALAASFALAACAARTPAAPAREAPIAQAPESAPATVSATSRDEAITIGYDRVFAVGTTILDEKDMGGDFSVDMTDGTRSMKGRFTMRKRVATRLEVLGTDPSGAVLTRLRVTYDEYTEDASFDGGAAEHRDALAGKTYLLTKQNGAFVVHDDEDHDAPAKEAALVKDDILTKTSSRTDAHHAGKAPPRFPSAPIRVGDAMPGYAAALADELGEGTDDARATLARIEVVDGEPAAAIATSVTMRQLLGEGTVMTWQLAGEVVVRARDGQDLLASLEGPATMEGVLDGAIGRPHLRGTGTMRVSWRRRFETEARPGGRGQWAQQDLNL